MRVIAPVRAVVEGIVGVDRVDDRAVGAHRPAAGYEHPATTGLHPARAHVDVTGPRWDPSTVDPDVVPAVPVPIARSPRPIGGGLRRVGLGSRSGWGRRDDGRRRFGRLDLPVISLLFS